MEGCLRCSGRAVPYSGGGVTPVTLTPNFEFPITAANLSGKTMTASSPVTMEDLIHGLNLISAGGSKYYILTEDKKYYLTDGAENQNTVSLSSDGLTITFGGEVGDPDIPKYTRFTFNA